MKLIDKVKRIFNDKKAELKIITDIEYHYMGCAEDGDEWFQRGRDILDVFQSLSLVDGDDLKDLIIMRIKELSKEHESIIKSPERYQNLERYKQKIGSYPQILVENAAVIRELKYLFNIKDEDLK